VIIKKISRYFLIISIFLSFYSSVKAAEQFKVEVSLLNAQAKLTKKQIFDKALKKAAKTLLIKLSAKLDINKQAKAREFLTRPSSWLKSYSYQPVKSEGVEIGKKIVFIFNQKLLYKYFQDNNLNIWPLQQRPVTLVLGSQKVINVTSNIKRSNIQYFPSLNYRYIAQQFSLPVKIPGSEIANKLWLTPNVYSPKSTLYGLSRFFSVDYILVFQDIVGNSGQKQIYWKLYDKQGNLALKGQENKKYSANSSLNNIFAKLLGFYSQKYFKQSSFFNSAILTVAGRYDFNKFAILEKTLQNLKPIIHQSRLKKMSNNKIVFELMYQGPSEYLIKRINNIKMLNTLYNPDLAGEIKAVW